MLGIAFTTTAKAVEINAVTQFFAPLQMEKDGELTGYAVETVREVLNRLEKKGTISKFDIQVLPWKRAMRQTIEKENTLFFSISRNPQREDKFHWIGEISPYEVHLFKLKQNLLPKIDSLDELKELNIRVGTQIGGNLIPILSDAGLSADTDFITYRHYSVGVPMLFRDRFDLMPLTKFVARTNVCGLGFNGDEIEPYFRVDKISNPLWVVMGKQTDPAIARAISEELEQLKAEGFVEAIQSQYLDQWANMPCVKKEDS